MLQDRWEGEDEEVKENWYDEEPEPETKPIQLPKKETFKEKIAKRESLAKLKKEKILKEKELKNKILSPEEKLVEKLERVKLQMESDLTIAKDTFSSNFSLDLDAIELSDKQSFDKFKTALISKLNSVSSSSHYISFLEELFKDLCVPIDTDDLKKISSNLTAIYNEKLKTQRNTNTKKKKSKGTSIKIEKSTTLLTKNYESDDDYIYDYDDFL